MKGHKLECSLKVMCLPYLYISVQQNVKTYYVDTMLSQQEKFFKDKTRKRNTLSPVFFFFLKKILMYF